MKNIKITKKLAALALVGLSLQTTALAVDVNMIEKNFDTVKTNSFAISLLDYPDQNAARYKTYYDYPEFSKIINGEKFDLIYDKKLDQYAYVQKSSIDVIKEGTNEIEIIEDLNFYVANKDQYLYDGCETLSKKIETVYEGEVVRSLGKTHNGYNLVNYNGKIGYLNSKDIENKKDTKFTFDNLEQEEINKIINKVKKEKNEKKYWFRLYFPSANFNVAVYPSFSQKTCDRKDSAASEFAGENGIVIADHNNQGFDCIKSFIEGKTVAYVCMGEYLEEYICVKNFQGLNTGDTLRNLHYEDVFDENQYGLTLYTCNDNPRNVTIVYLQKTGKILNKVVEKENVKVK